MEQSLEVRFLSAAPFLTYPIVCIIATTFCECYDEQVRYIPVFLVFILSLLFVQVPVAQASSEQAYRDYQFQYDVYRTRLNEYRIAYTQYKQFNSLAAQQDALERGKLFLAQRSQAAKTYFLFLNERLSENPGLGTGELPFYRAVITNQVAYLDQNLVLAPSAGSFEDARRVSDEFVKNNEQMQAAYRQIIAGIQLGYLNYFAKRFDDIGTAAQTLVAQSKTFSTPQKQQSMDRWLLSLSNKRSLFQQKSNTIRSKISLLTGDVTEQDRLLLEIQTTIGGARQDLVELAANLKELETALLYE